MKVGGSNRLVFGGLRMDRLDELVLYLAYTRIEASASKLVSGSEIWNDVIAVVDVAPVVVPARLKRLISRGLLVKDEANSRSRGAVYAPTDAGYRAWRELESKLPKTETIP